MGIHTEAVQKLYVAFFNRPADPAGLAFWEGVVANNNGNTAPISAAFSQSPEYVAAFAGLSNVQVVNTIYQNLFGRGAESEGLLFWAQALNEGRMTVGDAVLNISAGALATDLTAFNNKVKAATAFTEAVDTGAEIVAFSGDSANALAKAWLSAVTDDASLATQLATVDATVASVVAAAPAAPDANAGQTFTLTTGADTFTGTSGNDTFNGIIDATPTSATATTGDTLNGGAGTDTLNLIATTAATSGLLTLNSVENVNVRALAATTIDNLLFTGTTKVASVNSAAAVTLNNAALAATYSLENTVAASQADLTVNFRGADVTGTADVAALSINNVGSSILAAGATAPTVTSPAINVGAGIEAITLATAGTNFATVNSTTATKTVTLTGAATNTITFGTLNATSTIDASATTGTNVLNVGTGLTSGDTIKGGTGIDTVTATLSGSNTGVVLTGVENFTANATSTGVTLLTADAALTTLTNNSAAALTIGGAAGVNTVALNGSGVAGAQASTLTLTTAFAGAADSVALTLGNQGVAMGGTATHTASFTASGIETLAVTTADGVLGNSTVLTIADTGLQNLSITSVNNVTLDGIVAGTAGGTLSLLDTSASTGNFTWTEATAGVLATGAVVKLGGTALTTNTVTFGNEAATDIITVTGSAATDAITTGTGGIYNVTLGGASDTTSNIFNGANATAVNVTGAGGNDTITGSAGDDTINGGAGNDTITGGAGADRINVGTGTNTITNGTGDSGTFAAPVTNTLSTVTFDIITGMTAGDLINLTDVVRTVTSVDTLIDSDATDNTAVFVRGTYDAATQTFVGSATGTDSMLNYDTDIGAAVALEAIVLVGFVNTATAASGADGIFTLV